MIKQYKFNNIHELKNFKCEIVLPNIKNGKWIQDIYEKIIKEVKMQIFINDILDKEIIDTNINILQNINLDYLIDIIDYKITLNLILDTNLHNMCIWNLEYPPDIDGELYIKLN